MDKGRQVEARLENSMDFHSETKEFLGHAMFRAVI